MCSYGGVQPEEVSREVGARTRLHRHRQCGRRCARTGRATKGDSLPGGQPQRDHSRLAAVRRRLHPLPDVPGAVLTEHIGLNNYGQIAGLYVDTDNLIHGYLRTGRALTVVDVPGASETAAVKVNDQGQVVGVYEVGDNTCHGFLWENGTVTRIDFPGAVATRAFGINDLGDVVGSYLDTNGTAHGFLLRGGV